MNRPPGPEPSPSPAPPPGPGPVPVNPPSPRPNDTDQIAIATTRIIGDLKVPDRPDIPFVRVEGSLKIPPGVGRFEQVVIHFYLDDGQGKPGRPVQSQMLQFADVQGFAATGTPVYGIPLQGADATRRAVLPYQALVLPGDAPKTSRPFAQPVLFIDNFGVKTGAPLSFGMGG